MLLKLLLLTFSVFTYPNVAAADPDVEFYKNG